MTRGLHHWLSPLTFDLGQGHKVKGQGHVLNVWTFSCDALLLYWKPNNLDNYFLRTNVDLIITQFPDVKDLVDYSYINTHIGVISHYNGKLQT